MATKLLLVDDDTDVLTINKQYFEEHQYIVHTADDGKSAQAALSTFSPDCIILDIMLPSVDGFTLCQWFKKHTKAPIIFLTGKDSEDDKIKGLLLGGDDYVVKPYSLRELEARIQVLIRRYGVTAGPKDNHLSFPPLTIDLENHKAFYHQEEIALSNKEFDFLKILAQDPGKVFSFEELGSKIWGNYLESDRKTIMVTASRLRKKLAGYVGLENTIETVWSQGYKFVAH